MPGLNYLSSILDNYSVIGSCTRIAINQSYFLIAYKYKKISVNNVAIYFPEMAKVMENSYRATNIAFVEEWSS